MKQMKKLLIMLLVIAVAVSMVSAAAFAADGSFVVEAGTVSGTAGEDVVMTVKVSSNPGVIAAILNIKYDSTKLTLKSVTDVNFLNDETEVNIGNGECTIVLDNALATDNVATTGDLLKLTFAVAAEVSGEIDVDLTVVEAVNTELENVAVSAVDGKVTVAEVVTGPSIDDVDTSKLPDTLPAENISIEGNTMTINPVSVKDGETVTAPACVVLIKNGDTYTKVAATKQADGTYDFDVSDLNGGEIVVAVKGDANGDGEITVADYTAIARSLLQIGNNRYQDLGDFNYAVGDANGDGEITVADYTAIARSLLQNSNNRYFAITW